MPALCCRLADKFAQQLAERCDGEAKYGGGGRGGKKGERVGRGVGCVRKIERGVRVGILEKGGGWERGEDCGSEKE